MAPPPINHLMQLSFRSCAAAALLFGLSTASGADTPRVPVTSLNFARAETDMYMQKAQADNSFGKLSHRREPAAIDKQDVIRMNRDTLYSNGVFDLEAAPVTIVLPDAGKRFMSLQVISQDHFTTAVVYAPGRHAFTREQVGTRYVYFIVRTLADPGTPGDVKAANALQDAIQIEQTATGSLQLPDWDAAARDKARAALLSLASLGGTKTMFGTRDEVDPVSHLIGSAAGWGGNPPHAAIYEGVYPKANDGKIPHRLTVKDVPVDGFWSISVYNAKGFFELNEANAYSVNNLTAKPDPDGSITVQFGGDPTNEPNYLPITPGWNYTVRLYRPRKEILDGAWRFPEAEPVK
jgi:hypothetical protein